MNVKQAILVNIGYQMITHCHEFIPDYLYIDIIDHFEREGKEITLSELKDETFKLKRELSKDTLTDKEHKVIQDKLMRRL